MRFLENEEVRIYPSYTITIMEYHIATLWEIGGGCFLRLLLGRKVGYYFLLGSGIAYGSRLEDPVSAPQEERYTGYTPFKKDDPMAELHICQSIWTFLVSMCRHMDTTTCFVSSGIPSGSTHISVGPSIERESSDLEKECAPLLGKF